ncbi:MAG: hypothetical protein GY944_13520 [bacterium]|nr:hypothetical protein [bacterium]
MRVEGVENERITSGGAGSPRGEDGSGEVFEASLLQVLEADSEVESVSSDSELVPDVANEVTSSGGEETEERTAGTSPTGEEVQAEPVSLAGEEAESAVRIVRRVATASAGGSAGGAPAGGAPTGGATTVPEPTPQPTSDPQPNVESSPQQRNAAPELASQQAPARETTPHHRAPDAAPVPLRDVRVAAAPNSPEPREGLGRETETAAAPRSRPRDVAQAQPTVERVAVEANAERPHVRDVAPRQATAGTQTAVQSPQLGGEAQAQQREEEQGSQHRGTPGEREHATREADRVRTDGVRAEVADEAGFESQSLRAVPSAATTVASPTDPAISSVAANANPPVVTEPAQEAAEPAAPTSTARPMPAEAIPQHIEWLVARGGGSAQIQLHPPELGKLTIQVSVRGDDVQVVMNVREAAAQTLVAEYKESLENALTSKDLKLEQFEVRDWNQREGSPFREGAHHEHAEGGHRRGADRKGARGSGQKGIAGALAPPAAVPAQSLGAQGVSLRV